MKIRNKTILFIFMISLLISIIAFPSLKEQIPIHWGFDGKIDGYGSRYWIFLEPALILIFRFFMDFVRKIDPKKNSYHIFHREYDLFMIAIALFILAIQILSLGPAFGIQLPVGKLVIFIVGILLSFIGNLLPKLKPNYFMGIKTPWSIANETVWFKTHRIAGKIWFIGGILMALSIFLPNSIQTILFVTILSVMVLVPYVYSYYVYKKE